jgi:hypothetical protein
MIANVVIDIEATGKTHKSVFAVAICAKITGFTMNSSPRIIEEVFYMPEKDISLRSPCTMDWFNSNPLRKKYLEDSLEKCKSFTRETQARNIRNFFDKLYDECDDIVIYSDFPTFDVGFVCAILADYNLLPIYLKSDGACPSSVVNYNNYLKGYAHVHPTVWSSEVYKSLDLEIVKREEDHDPLKDVRHILEEVEMVLYLVIE